MPQKRKAGLFGVALGSPKTMVKYAAQYEEETLKNMRATLAYILEEGLHADIKIETRQAGEATPAHSAILCGVSPVFKAMLSSAPMPPVGGAGAGGGVVLKLDDFGSTAALRAFLRLVYVGVLDARAVGPEHALDMAAAAHKYQLPLLLRGAVAAALAAMLAPENCLRILECADVYGDAALLRRCNRFVARHFAAVVREEGFAELAARKPALAVHIVRANFKCADNETGVAARFAKLWRRILRCHCCRRERHFDLI